MRPYRRVAPQSDSHGGLWLILTMLSMVAYFHWWIFNQPRPEGAPIPDKTARSRPFIHYAEPTK